MFSGSRTSMEELCGIFEGDPTNISLSSSKKAYRKDKNGTEPVPMNAVEAQRLRDMYLNNTYLIVAGRRMSEMLFSSPFGVSVGKLENSEEPDSTGNFSSSPSAKGKSSKASFGKREISEDVKESIISKFWLPALRKMHYYLLQFGFAPYQIVDAEFPNLEKKRFSETSSSSSSSSSSDDIESKRKSGGKNGDEIGEQDGASLLIKELDKQERSRGKKGKRKRAEMEGEGEGGNDEDSTEKSNSAKRRKKDSKNPKNVEVSILSEMHRYPKVLDYEMGFVSVCIDSDSVKRLYWTWHSERVPKDYEDPVTGYTDLSVRFVVKDEPTITGFHSCPLASVLPQWTRLRSAQTMAILADRDALNPHRFVQKAPPKEAKVTSATDQLINGYSSLFNANNDDVVLQGVNRGGGGGEGESVRRPAMDGLVDMGLGNYADTIKYRGGGYSSLAPSRFGIGAGNFHSTLYDRDWSKEGPRGVLVGLKRFDFGNMGGPSSYATDLLGYVRYSPDDPNLSNPMSGVCQRITKLLEGETLVHEATNGLEAYRDPTPISVSAINIAEECCTLAGVPLSYLLGRSTTGISKSGGSSGTSPSGSLAGGKGGAGKQASVTKGRTTDVDSSREVIMASLAHHQAFYQEVIASIFSECYYEAITNLKKSYLKGADHVSYAEYKNELAINVTLNVKPPQIESSVMTAAYSEGMVTLEELVRHRRQNLGLPVDVVYDKSFMRETKRKIDNVTDVERMYELEKKYAPEPATKAGSPGAKKAPQGKKKAAVSNAKKASSAKATTPSSKPKKASGSAGSRAVEKRRTLGRAPSKTSLKRKNEGADGGGERKKVKKA